MGSPRHARHRLVVISGFVPRDDPVLTEAAIEGKSDGLLGLKENIIIGKLSGRHGMAKYRNITVDTPEAQRMSFWSSDLAEPAPTNLPHGCATSKLSVWWLQHEHDMSDELAYFEEPTAEAAPIHSRSWISSELPRFPRFPRATPANSEVPKRVLPSPANLQRLIGRLVIVPTRSRLCSKVELTGRE